jgi:hypothetical protein
MVQDSHACVCQTSAGVRRFRDSRHHRQPDGRARLELITAQFSSSDVRALPREVPAGTEAPCP